MPAERRCLGRGVSVQVPKKKEGPQAAKTGGRDGKRGWAGAPDVSSTQGVVRGKEGPPLGKGKKRYLRKWDARTKRGEEPARSCQAKGSCQRGLATVEASRTRGVDPFAPGGKDRLRSREGKTGESRVQKAKCARWGNALERRKSFHEKRELRPTLFVGFGRETISIGGDIIDESA